MVRIAGEVELGDQSLALAENLEMDVGGANVAPRRRIGAGLDRAQIVAAVLVGLDHGKALEARIERRRIVVVGMRIAAEAVGLPDLQLATPYRLAGAIENPAGYADDLALGATGPPRNAGEIAPLGRLGERIEGAEDLVGRPWQEPGADWRCRVRLNAG